MSEGKNQITKIQPITASLTASYTVTIGRPMPSHRASFVDKVYSIFKNNIRFGNDIDPKLEAKSRWGCVNPKIYETQKPVIKPIPCHTATSSIGIGVRGTGYGIREKGTGDREQGTEETKGKTISVKTKKPVGAIHELPQRLHKKDKSIPTKADKHELPQRLHKKDKSIPTKADKHELPQQLHKKEKAIHELPLEAASSLIPIVPKPLKTEWAIGYPGGAYSLGILPIKDDSRIEVSLFANESEMKKHNSTNVEAGLLSYILYNGNSNLTGKLPIRTLEYKTLSFLEFNNPKNDLNVIATSVIANNWKAELDLTSDGRLSARFSKSAGNQVYIINADFETKQIEYDQTMNLRILKTFESENNTKIFFAIDDSLQLYTGVMEKDDKIKSLLKYRF